MSNNCKEIRWFADGPTSATEFISQCARPARIEYACEPEGHAHLTLLKPKNHTFGASGMAYLI